MTTIGVPILLQCPSIVRANEQGKIHIVAS